MAQLVIMRHAHAAPPGPAGDRARPLSARGQRQAEEVGRALAGEGWQPELLAYSSAPRAAETAERVAQALALPKSAHCPDGRLYAATAMSLWYWLAEVPATCGRVMLVGHNPGISELAAYLLGGQLAGLTTGAAMWLDTGDRQWSELVPGQSEQLARYAPETR